MPTSLFKYRRRRYETFGQFYSELAFLLKNRRLLKQAMLPNNISGKFRQRLMLAVTSVNRCRYCAAYHSRVSLSAGLSKEEITELLDGSVQDCPTEELPALLYARNWAEQNGQVDRAAFAELAAIYGLEKAEWIELSLKTIRMGNLSGNTFDYLLCKLSGGRFGCPELRQNPA
jgi:AhpD family alkylhydroperoxidase